MFNSFFLVKKLSQSLWARRCGEDLLSRFKPDLVTLYLVWLTVANRLFWTFQRLLIWFIYLFIFTATIPGVWRESSQKEKYPVSGRCKDKIYQVNVREWAVSVDDKKTTQINNHLFQTKVCRNPSLNTTRPALKQTDDRCIRLDWEQPSKLLQFIT